MEIVLVINCRLLRVQVNLFIVIKVLQMGFGQVVRELLLLNIRDGVNILELSLSVPVLVEEIVVAPQLLSYFTDEMEVLLSQES